jgi:expansin (peptidoglycan-binding protein)
MDMSYGAFRRIANVDNGNATICWRVVG